MCKIPQRELIAINYSANIRIDSLTEKHWPEVAAIYGEGIATGHATFESELPDWGHFATTHDRTTKRGGCLIAASAMPRCQAAFNLDSARVLHDDHRPPVFGRSDAAAGGAHKPRPTHAYHILTWLGQGHRKGNRITSDNLTWR
jgi:hypothetical protein